MYYDLVPGIKIYEMPGVSMVSMYPSCVISYFLIAELAGPSSTEPDVLKTEP